MGWRGFMRSVGASARRAERQAERAASRRRRELLAEAKQHQAMQEEALARHHVALYENYIDTLISLHKECWNPWNWHQVVAMPPPPAPVYTPRHENAARHALQTYEPGMTDRMLSREAVRRQELTNAIAVARQQDHAEWQHAMAQHQAAHARWAWFNGVARGVLAGEMQAYEAVIGHLSPFQELNELGTYVNISSKEPWYVLAELTVRDTEVVPDETYSVTAKGKLSTKAIAKSKYHEIYQDHVASCALRIARELFALLPIEFAFINVNAVLVNAATGHQEPFTILSVGFERMRTQSLNFDAIDPSSSLSNFVHKMDFKKTTGFKTVERLDPLAFRPPSARRFAEER